MKYSKLIPALLLLLFIPFLIPAYADDSGFKGKHYEYDYPLYFPTYQDRFIQPTLSAVTTECYNFTYVITNWLKDVPIAQQEELVRMLFEEFWGEFMKDVCFEYKKDANPDDVYGLIQMSVSCGKGEGCGGGEGPNTWCIASNTSGTFSNGKLDLILAHEIGHCLGLPHFTGINAFDCMMAPTGQPNLRHCTAELNKLKSLWDGAICYVPTCMPDGSSVTNGVMLSLTPSQIPVKGDIITLTYCIKNIGNTQLIQTVWIRDFTDNKLLYQNSAGLVLPGDTKCVSFTWDLTDAIIGNHSITALYSNSRSEIDSSNNILKLNIEVIGVIIPPPPPPPIVNYFIDYDETVSISDMINVTHIVGPPAPDPIMEELEAKIILLEEYIVLLEEENQLLRELAKIRGEIIVIYESIIDQIRVLVE